VQTDKRTNFLIDQTCSFVSFESNFFSFSFSLSSSSFFFFSPLVRASSNRNGIKFDRIALEVNICTVYTHRLTKSDFWHMLFFHYGGMSHDVRLPFAAAYAAVFPAARYLTDCVWRHWLAVWRHSCWFVCTCCWKLIDECHSITLAKVASRATSWVLVVLPDCSVAASTTFKWPNDASYSVAGLLTILAKSIADNDTNTIH